MDLPVRKKLPHTVPQWVPEGSWFFITIKCVPPGKNQLCGDDGAHGVTRPTSVRQVGRVSPLPAASLEGQGKPLEYSASAWAGNNGARGVTRPTVGDGVIAALAHNHDKLAWHCRLALLMPDHLHGIFAFPAEPGMKTTVTNWKRFVAGKLGVDWQRDFFDHRLRTDQELQEKTSYILMNPVRKGLCQRAEDWVWVYRPDDRPPPQLG